MAPSKCFSFNLLAVIIIQLLLAVNALSSSSFMAKNEKLKLKLKTLEMFDHAFGAYKRYAHPADELMPLSCKGRYRGSEEDRGDIDEALGNFSLTLVDTLDTLVVLGMLDEFDVQVRYVIQNVSFNADAVVSVFETNIRILGGLLGAHSVAVTLKQSGKGMLWYQDELLTKAVDVGDRLLAAFNTTTGIPYPKVNLRYGINHLKSRVGHETDTCTACAGTMIMEFGALSRLTGNSIYEDKAHKAMDALWKYRSLHSDLVGTTINIHNGDWSRRDSGIGAGIDSYYEYCLKAYILLGDESYLEKFNKHYAAIKRYIHQGYMFIDVLMHQPEQPIRSFMDSLQAFWPGLQVLKGDLKPAIETHEMLYTVAKKYNFLPEAFTTNFDLHWAQHPLRPEFVESTYFLYQATKDPYYLTVGKHVLESLEKYARVPCGFAALKDLRTLNHEDKMDSFVLAETFKYLYLLFSEESEHLINIHDFIFTTEAHLLPLYLSTRHNARQTEKSMTRVKSSQKSAFLANKYAEDHMSCPNNGIASRNLRSFAEIIRANVNNDGLTHVPSCTGELFAKKSSTSEKILAQIKLNTSKRPRHLTAAQFQIGNKEHAEILKALGITLTKAADGKLQLTHQAALALTTQDAEEGITFMQEMIQLAKVRGEQQGIISQPRIVQLLSSPFNSETLFEAGSAQFGADLAQNNLGVSAQVIETVPYRACQDVQNGHDIANRIAVIERGDCMFIDKVRLAQAFGAIGVIIIDHTEGSSSENTPQFGMSGDGNPSDVFIPSVFLFKKEGELLRKQMKELDDDKLLEVRLRAKKAGETGNTDKTDPPQPAVPVPNKEENKLDPSKVSGDDVTNKLLGSLHSTPSVQKVRIDSQGQKISTTISKFIGLNSKGVLKRIIKKNIETCPTVECDKGVTYTVVMDEEELSESEKLSQSNEKTKDSNADNVDKPVNSVDKLLENTGKSIVNQFQDISSIITDSFLDSFVSESLKENLNEKSKIKHQDSKFCNSAGCFNSLEELQSMNNKLTQAMNQIEKIQEELSGSMSKTLNEKVEVSSYKSNDLDKNERIERTKEKSEL